MEVSAPFGETSIGLVLGAGGPTGGAFIDAALEVFATEAGFEPAMASRIVGTSAGAFVAARIRPQPAEGSNSDGDEMTTLLSSLDNLDSMKATKITQLVRGLRLAGGRAFALLAPPEIDQALYDVAPGPYHPGASAVTIEHTWGTRREYNLAEHIDEAENIVRASAAIPYKNGPIAIGRVKHADGAVHSANNVDLLSPEECPIIIVVSPMVPSSGGTKASAFHRAQLAEELRPWGTNGYSAIVVMPTAEEHENRRNREAFREAGANAARRVFGKDQLGSID